MTVSPSAYLDAESQAFFAELLDELADAGINLESVDKSLLDTAALLKSTIAASTRDITERGYYLDQVRGGYNGSDERIVREPNPAIAVRDKAMAHLNTVLDRLGIGPEVRRKASGVATESARPADVIRGLDSARRFKAVPGGKASSA